MAPSVLLQELRSYNRYAWLAGPKIFQSVLYRERLPILFRKEPMLGPPGLARAGWFGVYICTKN